MTEEEHEAELQEEEETWLTSGDPRAMYRCTFGRASGRKYHLLCVASCRYLDAALDESYWQLLDRLEQAADAAPSKDEEKQLKIDAWQYEEKFSAWAEWSISRYTAFAIGETAFGAYDDAFDCLVSAAEDAHVTFPALTGLCAVLREIFGTPSTRSPSSGCGAPRM